jgi:hypothetical protein
VQPTDGGAGFATRRPRGGVGGSPLGRRHRQSHKCVAGGKKSRAGIYAGLVGMSPCSGPGEPRREHRAEVSSHAHVEDQGAGDPRHRGDRRDPPDQREDEGGPPLGVPGRAVSRGCGTGGPRRPQGSDAVRAPARDRPGPQHQPGAQAAAGVADRAEEGDRGVGGHRAAAAAGGGAGGDLVQGAELHLGDGHGQDRGEGAVGTGAERVW